MTITKQTVDEDLLEEILDVELVRFREFVIGPDGVVYAPGTQKDSFDERYFRR